MNRTYLVSITLPIFIFFIANGMQPPAPARQIRNAPSLKFNTAYSIAKLLDDCEKVHKDVAKLDKNTKQYLEDLKTLIQRYKIFHNGNGNLLEDPTQALFCAVELGFMDIIPDLIALGANINATTGPVTPIIIAAGNYYRSIINSGRFITNRPFAAGDMIGLQQNNLKNSASLIDLLISLGANVNAVNTESGWTALHYTVSDGNLHSSEVLIQNGADVNSKSAETQQTPVYVAINRLKNPIKILALLIEKGADINAQDRRGNTPLIDAIRTGNINVVKFLLFHKARLDIVNNQGKTALQIAQEKGQQDIIKILQHYLQKEQK